MVEGMVEDALTALVARLVTFGILLIYITDYPALILSRLMSTSSQHHLLFLCAA